MIDVLGRLEILERRVQRLQVSLFLMLVVATGGLLMARPLAQATDAPLRVKGLIIEDSNGQPRVVLGAPIPGDGRSTNLRAGLRINDPNGVERFGVSLFEDGRMVLGLDAPRGKGDDRNRERINLVADQEGGSYIRFLDRRTLVAGRLYLDDQNRLWVEFSDATQTPPLRKRIGLAGEEVIRTPQ
jgi:hypothetical protein